MRRLLSSLIALIAASVAPAALSEAMAADPYYVGPAEIDLVHILAPPPTPDSPAGKADLQAVLAVVNSRTDAEIKQARDDDQRSVFRFADVMGGNFRAETLPLTAQLFQHVYEDGNGATLAAKSFFQRKRPFVVDPAIKIIVVQAPDFSYPSNHSTFGNNCESCSRQWFPRKRSKFLPARRITPTTALSPAFIFRAMSKPAASRRA